MSTVSSFPTSVFDKDYQRLLEEIRLLEVPISMLALVSGLSATTLRRKLKGDKEEYRLTKTDLINLQSGLKVISSLASSGAAQCEGLYLRGN